MNNGTGDPDTGAETEAALSLDAILDILSHHHRRTVLGWLRDQPDQRAAAEDLVEQLLAAERHRTGKIPVQTISR